MIRNVNLIEHLPLFVQEFREIQGIMNAENPEIQSVEDNSEQIKNNMLKYEHNKIIERLKWIKAN